MNDVINFNEGRSKGFSINSQEVAFKLHSNHASSQYI